MRKAQAFWIISVIAACYLVAFSVPNFAIANPLSQASYVPDELKQLPPHVTIVGDYSGYWAGENAPLVRCVQLREGFEDERRPFEVVPGIMLEDIGHRSVLLFYYLALDGAWQRIGHLAYYWIGDIYPVEMQERRMLHVSVHNPGNWRSQRQVHTFSFHEHCPGCIALSDCTPSVEGMSPISLHSHNYFGEPAYVVYPTMGVDWEGYGPFCHADSPDRYILLGLNEDETVVNVSTDYPGFYMRKVADAEERFLQQLTSLDSYEDEMTDLLPVWKDNAYMSYAVTLLIRYHDMGKHDEGIRLARLMIKRKHFSNHERVSVCSRAS